MTLLNASVQALHPQAREQGVELVVDPLPRLPLVYADPQRIGQVVRNLLTNAFRWTPDGGTVELALSAQNGTVAVSVSDTGPGITLEERERIFRPFWSRDGGGTGLGLAIARELATALGGRIELETAPGRGSRFALVLPADPAEL